MHKAMHQFNSMYNFIHNRALSTKPCKEQNHSHLQKIRIKALLDPSQVIITMNKNQKYRQFKVEEKFSSQETQKISKLRIDLHQLKLKD